MTAWVGIVSHPYFTVSDVQGRLRSRTCLPGNGTFTAWHEAFGALTKAVEVKAGQTATVDFRLHSKKP